MMHIMEVVRMLGELLMLGVMVFITIQCYKFWKYVQRRVIALLDKYDRISDLMDKNAHADVFLAKFSSKSKDHYHVLT